MWIYKPDNEKHNFDVREWQEGEKIPEGWTEKEPPVPAYKIVYDWEQGKWLETATTEEIEELNRDPEFEKRQRQAGARQKVFELMMNRFVLEEELTEEQIDTVLDMYEEYMVGKRYTPGDTFQYEGAVYEVIQPHVSQEDWKPDSVPALYKLFIRKELPGGVPVVPVWKEPTGAQDAYKVGDKVSYKGKVYESVIAGNVWSPEGYPAGWKEVGA